MSTKKVEDLSNENEIKEIETEVIEQQNAPLFEPVEIGREDELSPFNNVVETERKEILKANQMASRRSSIGVAIMMVMCVVAMIFLNNEKYSFITWIALGVGVVSVLVFSLLNKRIKGPDPKSYIRNASLAINKHVFNDSSYGNMVSYPDKKLSLEDVYSDGIYEKVADVSSRNLVEGTFEDRKFKVCEAALFKVKTAKQKTTYFIGKLIEIENNLTFDGQFVLVKKGEVESDEPNLLGDYNLLSESQYFNVYGTNGVELKALPKSFIEDIEKFEIKEHLLHLTFIVKQGRTIIYASYDDDVITLPFYNPLVVSGVEQYTDNLKEILKISQKI